MSAFLYFIPETNKNSLSPAGELARARLRELGLGHVFADCHSLSDDVSAIDLGGRGPDDRCGVILCALPVSREAPRRLGYYAKEQTWLPGPDDAEGRPRWYLGFNPAEPPKPADLARVKVIKGYRVELNGQTWEVPLLRAPSGDSNLPQTLGWDRSGSLTTVVREQYREAWERSAITYDALLGGGSLDYATALDLCLEALALNYRLGRLEVTTLELLDTQNFIEVLGSTIDLPKVKELVEAAKKNEEQATSGSSPTTPASGNGSPGDEASIETTDPAAATSGSSP
ncbi:MAG: hypothetical protein KY476_00700 [Planctomycetes bacterium]|nr:hypothetical protein [Planctomycetota bacterium]